jgi:hypothetical protein
MIGSAEQLTDKLLDAQRTLNLNRIYAQIDWGGLPRPWSKRPSPATPPTSPPHDAPHDGHRKEWSAPPQ